VITDGNDNSSDITLEQVLRQAQSSDVLIYAIGLLNEEEARDARAAKKALKALVDASGGWTTTPRAPATFRNHAARGPRDPQSVCSRLHVFQSVFGWDLPASQGDVTGFGAPRSVPAAATTRHPRHG
jgi:hypothetical protein